MPTQLGRPFRRTELDILEGESRTPEFLEKNPNGRIPVLEMDDGRCLAESNAILWYLARGTRFLADDPLDRAPSLQCMFFEPYPHEPHIATARFWLHHPEITDERRAMLELKAEQGYAALGVIEGHLAKNDYFAAGAYSIADIALYAYTHVADEGGFDLGSYAAVLAWLDRVAGQPDHIPITQG